MHFGVTELNFRDKDRIAKLMKVLIVDDTQSNLELTSLYVRRAGHQVITAADGKQGIEAFVAQQPDLVLLDVNMPKVDGYECARRIRSQCQEGNLWVPIIFLSAIITDEAIVKGIEAGGDDYLPKPVSQAVLGAKLKAMQRIALMRHELEEASERLRELSLIDGLTQIYNRRHFDESLSTEMAQAERTGAPLSLLICDVDHFKAYNDCYGHVRGDEALKAVARALDSVSSRPHDLAARIGGEEFVLLLPATARQGAAKLAGALVQAIRDLQIPHADSPSADYLTVSIGMATYRPNHGHASPEMVIGSADLALYEAKQTGRNQVRCHQEQSLSRKQ